MVLKHIMITVRVLKQEIKKFQQEAKSSPKILCRSQDHGKAVDNGLSVGKVVQFLYVKNTSSVSREYVWHAWVSTGDDVVRRPAGCATALAQIVQDDLA